MILSSRRAAYARDPHSLCGLRFVAFTIGMRLHPTAYYFLDDRENRPIFGPISYEYWGNFNRGTERPGDPREPAPKQREAARRAALHAWAPPATARA